MEEITQFDVKKFKAI
jgi:hypothetical protein